jgi:hypothetical protein
MAKRLNMWILVLVGATCIGAQAQIIQIAATNAASETVSSSTKPATPDEPRKPTGTITGVDEF